MAERSSPPFSLGNRPAWIQHRVEEDFAYAAKAQTYRHNGVREEYVFPLTSEHTISTTEMVAELETIHDRPLRILDIGTGCGKFILTNLERGHDAYGITAFDYRQSPSYRSYAAVLDSNRYIVGDAHYLEQIVPAIPGYDLLVSQWCLIHCVDPLDIVRQAAGLVAEGGLLALDRLTVNTASTYSPEDDILFSPQHILGSLLESGYDFADAASADITASQAQQNAYELPPLFLRRERVAPIVMNAYYGAERKTYYQFPGYTV